MTDRDKNNIDKIMQTVESLPDTEKGRLLGWAEAMEILGGRSDEGPRKDNDSCGSGTANGDNRAVYPSGAETK